LLFSSPEFLFAFLPLTLLLVVAAAWTLGRRAVLVVLIIASVAFYGWWKPAYLILLAVSVLGNYAFGRVLMRGPSRPVLTLGVAFNLGLLGYFKYAYFLVDGMNAIAGTGFQIGTIVLPLAISFYTFQQIAFLVDAHQGKVKDTSFIHYCLFVTFFPQLIAGPIVHHADVIPQFEKGDAFTIRLENLWVGLAIFVIGLYKKIIFADGIAVYADSVFAGALQNPTFFEAWGGTLAYSFQIYFDFSGYSDMAIGLARVFGVRLPLNFHSPYKALNIIEFWRRWHMTLSRFLRDYLYFPLGGSRKGWPRRYANLMTVMLLGGLWHGAGWAFVIWGGLHGLYLVINHAWQALRRALGHDLSISTAWGRGLSRGLTFLAVVVAWTFFRGESWQGSLAILEGMAGLNGIVLPPRIMADLGGLSTMLEGLGLSAGKLRFLDISAFGWLAALLAVVWLAPNTQQWLDDHDPALDYDRRRHSFDFSGMAVVTEAAANTMRSFRHIRAVWMIPFIAWASGVAMVVVAVRGSDMAPFIYMFF
jgi:D-alanyl-lipoteichoic acid acyltransferase DltB (MBOAT superfamily)